MAEKTELKTKLAENRAALFTLLNGLTDEQWQVPVFSEETIWTVADMVRHLEGAERSMITLMANIQQGGGGASEDFDLARFNASRIKKAKEKQIPELMEAMEKNREDLLAFMDSLTEEDWQKKGRHGSLRIMTIEEICTIIADHEASHAADIESALHD
ncbi:MAG: DinB family protein [Anaerolineae bacterium]|nr:DinB family protein [Anaerolineae bacterium]